MTNPQHQSEQEEYDAYVQRMERVRYAESGLDFALGELGVPRVLELIAQRMVAPKIAVSADPEPF